MKTLNLSLVLIVLLLSSSFATASDYEKKKECIETQQCEMKAEEKCEVKKQESKKECCDMKSSSSSPAFNKLKALAGTWNGTHEMNGKNKPVRITYRVTAGGSALVEILGPGSPEEMVSVYTAQGKKIRMVHYCMMGNQPHLVLDSYNNNIFHFKYAKSPGISTRNDSYMGELTLTVKDKNHMVQKWTAFKKGKQMMEATEFALTRI